MLSSEWLLISRSCFGLVQQSLQMLLFENVLMLRRESLLYWWQCFSHHPRSEINILCTITLCMVQGFCRSSKSLWVLCFKITSPHAAAGAQNSINKHGKVDAGRWLVFTRGNKQPFVVKHQSNVWCIIWCSQKCCCDGMTWRHAWHNLCTEILDTSTALHLPKPLSRRLPSTHAPSSIRIVAVWGLVVWQCNYGSQNSERRSPLSSSVSTRTYCVSAVVTPWKHPKWQSQHLSGFIFRLFLHLETYKMCVRPPWSSLFVTRVEHTINSIALH